MIHKKGPYHISTDKKELDIPFIHHFLSTEAYWCNNIPLDIVQKSIENSFCFGLYKDKEQIGFARVITDFSTIAYLGDVFIIKKHRGQGLSKWLMQVIMQHPKLQGFRRWILLTSSAHDLYKKYGFNPLPKPEIYMEKFNPEIYLKAQ